MSNALLVKIILPSNLLVKEEVDMVNIPGTEGVFGVLLGHAKLNANIDVGIVTLFIKEVRKKYYIHTGVAEVNEKCVNIITEFAVDLEGLSKSSVSREIKQLEENLLQTKERSIEYEIVSEKISNYKTLLKFIDT